jgi:hypothetical protein
MRRRKATDSLPKQAFALRASFPNAKLELSPHRLLWHGAITPTALSRTYDVSINFSPPRYPTVRVLAPALQDRPGESIPHLFSNGSLCLHLDDEWSSAMLLVHTIVPWTSEWLFNYEIWLATGTWNGGGEWPPRGKAKSDPSWKLPMSERDTPSRRRPR